MYLSHRFRKVLSPPACHYNIKLTKPFLDNKNKFSKNDKSKQNVYYRNFDSPKRRGLSPNSSKKIVIQYSSPPKQLNDNYNSSQIKSLSPKRVIIPNPISSFNNIIQGNNKVRNEISHSQRINISNSNPRNIYTNENTPPRAKYLQKRSSRKNSEERNSMQLPLDALDFA
jgi:hypothetical protein